MRKEIRRFVMFCTILTIGLLLLFIDVTFIELLFLLLILAIVLPFLLGLVTITEVRDTFATFKEQKLKKIGLLKKLDDIKLFEKKGAQKQEISRPKLPVKPEPAAAKPAVAEGSLRKMPFSAQIGSLVTSIKSLGTTIRERTRRERKVTEINKMLDSTISEKVEKKATPAAPAIEASLPAPAGAKSVPSGDADPFLSLSDDEFDAGLLDGLDDGDMGMPETATEGGVPAGESLDMPLPEPELSMPSLEMDSAASDILKANMGDEGLDGFSSLDMAGEDADTDFGDLDSLSLDDVDIDADLAEDLETGGMTSTAPAAEASEPAAPAPPAPAESSAVKTTWIPSDAPKGADQSEDQIGMQSDMAAFASSAGGTDEDLLSSIASDVKRATKEKDISLLRELKDFKAPADQIDKELTDMYKRLSAAQKPNGKPDSATKEIK